MRTGKAYLLVIALLLFLLSLPVKTFADTAAVPESGGSRNIYIGDIITLKITAQGLSSDELRQAFQDFEIVELKEAPGGRLLSLRTFETGEYTILLADKEIVISVLPTSADIQRDDIFEADTWVIKPGITAHWRMFFYIAFSVFILSGGFVLSRIILKRRIKPPGPYQLFLRQAGALSAEDDNYFVDLTFYFKRYLENLYQCRIIGKTSAEILNELKKIQAHMLPAIQVWMAECDRLKFTGVMVSIDKKREHYKELLDLAEKIDSQKIDAHKEEAA